MKKVVPGLLPLFCLSGIGEALADEKPAVRLDTVEVIGITPLQSGEIAAEKVPAHVQTVTSEQLQDAQSLSLSDYMNRYMGSVHINEAQNNPLQPDVYYRGFVASPLLGLPQGLSVYVNGVRFNEPFGDSVNWDLLPPGAIDTMTLSPGSNPVYGLNTLGGAISVKTKTGFSAPGHRLEAYGGSWDRHSEELSSGWNNGTFGYFIDLRHFDEEGWRDFSPTSAQQVFGTLSWRNERGSLDLTLGANDNDMKGNGAVPEQLHNLQRKAIFTHPDQTITRMFFSELSGSFDVTDNIQLSGNAYFRQNRIKTFNGDDSDFEECDPPNGLLCDEENEIVEDIFASPVAASDSVEGATNNTSQTHMRSTGGTIQSLFSHDIFGHENSFIFGAAYDYADVHFESDTELAQLTDSRGTIGSGILIDEARVRLNTTTENYSFYFSDTFSLTDDFDVTFAGRYNHTSIDMRNMRSRFLDGEDKLSGHHNFERFNPSVGYTWRMLDNVTMYGSYSESSRVPTPMELSCADPEDPCRLPNSFLADPPLDQVVAKSWETGFRGNLNELMGEGRLSWNVGFFHTTNHDDIIFRRDGDSLSEGYFSNVGQTLRYGVESGFSVGLPQLFSEIDDWHFSTNYTYLNARYLDGFTIQNPLDNDEAARVRRGDRIPGLPEHLYKATLGVTLWQRWSLAIDTQYSGEQYFRGDEANLTDPLGGYWLFNARTEVKVTDYLTVFGKIDNIFDRDYKTFGVYGEADEVLGDDFDNPRFVSPGAPRAGWVGVRITL
ncbi:TonB-dependent receptor [Methylomarinum vadi]|uniref:TonB-dependent receptor n=1 Tax=Methylomarinum vadi TaxID=438855 RepID=UPI0004DF34F5|nr:TonB-dependent receptor [Methylomarinum vadi]